MKAIILVGGMGTRLRSVVSDIPKPMALIGDKPFLELLLDYLVVQGCKEVILAVGYLHHKIIEYFGNRYKSISITYSIESSPLGTGGAIFKALELINNNDNVFVINGDTLCKIDYEVFYNYHINNKSNLSMVVKEYKNITRFGSLKINSNNIVTNFYNKNFQRGLINCGIYILNKSIFNTFNTKKSFSFENDFLLSLTNKLNILAYKTQGFFIDIGVPEDYKLLNKLFS